MEQYVKKKQIYDRCVMMQMHHIMMSKWKPGRQQPEWEPVRHHCHQPQLVCSVGLHEVFECWLQEYVLFVEIIKHCWGWCIFSYAILHSIKNFQKGLSCDFVVETTSTRVVVRSWFETSSYAAEGMAAETYHYAPDPFLPIHLKACSHNENITYLYSLEHYELNFFCLWRI